MSLRIFVLLLVLPLGARAAADEQGVDFSHYDKPLFTQMVDHIKAKIAARIGEAVNPKDRFFIIPYAYQNKANDPELSHSFISVVRVLADNKQPKLTPGLEKQSYRNRGFEAFTISWLPRGFSTDTHLCVFDGFGSRLNPAWNKCPVSPGENFGLADTIKLAVHVHNAVAMWGPYEITQPGFELGVKRKELLDGGTIKYKADDRITRKQRVAINCFHAMAGLEELFPNGGLFGTGFKMWGFNGTARVLIEYSEVGHRKGLLLEPVDVKKDRYGFV